MSKKSSGCNQTFLLNGEGIDSCSHVMEKQLKELGVAKDNCIRVRFSMEECLLRMRDYFGEEERFTLKIDTRFGRAQVQIEMDGQVFNPLSKTQAEMEAWNNSLLTAVGVSPLYSYSNGKNILRLSVVRKSLNQVLKLLITIGSSLVVAHLLNVFVPEVGQVIITDSVLKPIYDLWIRLLTVVSAPVIFLMVLTSVMNTGTIEEEGGSSKRVVFRYMGFSLIFATIAVIVSGLVSRNPLTFGSTLGVGASHYLEAVLKIVPSNLIEPFVQGNTPQLLFLAFVAGNLISLLGSKIFGLRNVIQQVNMCGMLLTEGISRSVPYFAGILVCLEGLEGRLGSFRGIGEMLVLSLLVSIMIMTVVLLYVSIRKKVFLPILMGKIWPSFITTIRRGRIEQGFGTLQQSTINDLGIERHFAVVSLPFGLVLYMPINVIGTITFTIFAAVHYHLSISPGWLLIAIVLAVVLFVSTPPVPGANLLAYIIIFAQLQIPPEALIAAMIFDIIFGIFATAANQMLLQLDLILQSDRIGLLNKKRLRKQRRKG